MTGDQFMMAFALEDYDSRVARGDPRYVKWIARYLAYDKNSILVKDIAWQLNLCTEDDLEKFDEPKGDAA